MLVLPYNVPSFTNFYYELSELKQKNQFAFITLCVCVYIYIYICMHTLLSNDYANQMKLQIIDFLVFIILIFLSVIPALL